MGATLCGCCVSRPRFAEEEGPRLQLPLLGAAPGFTAVEEPALKEDVSSAGLVSPKTAPTPSRSAGREEPVSQEATLVTHERQEEQEEQEQLTEGESSGSGNQAPQTTSFEGPRLQLPLLGAAPGFTAVEEPALKEDVGSAGLVSPKTAPTPSRSAGREEPVSQEATLVTHERQEEQEEQEQLTEGESSGSGNQEEQEEQEEQEQLTEGESSESGNQAPQTTSFVRLPIAVKVEISWQGAWLRGRLVAFEAKHQEALVQCHCDEPGVLTRLRLHQVRFRPFRKTCESTASKGILVAGDRVQVPYQEELYLGRVTRVWNGQVAVQCDEDPEGVLTYASAFQVLLKKTELEPLRPEEVAF